jgi:hypothetical protein
MLMGQSGRQTAGHFRGRVRALLYQAPQPLTHGQGGGTVMAWWGAAMHVFDIQEKAVDGGPSPP